MFSSVYECFYPWGEESFFAPGQGSTATITGRGEPNVKSLVTEQTADHIELALLFGQAEVEASDHHGHKQSQGG